MKRIHENISLDESKTKNIYRDRIDLLRSRVSLLSSRDKLLMTMYLENGNSVRQLAQLAGTNNTRISRRIKMITRRLVHGDYILCLHNREKFTPLEMLIAKDYFLSGLSLKKSLPSDTLHTIEPDESYKRLRALLKLSKIKAHLKIPTSNSGFLPNVN